VSCRKVGRLWLAAVVLIVALPLAVVGCGGGGRTPGGQQGPAAAFLASYVQPDGRVSRPDQGDDTVSEGQAYGMLFAEAARKEGTFGRIWRWTRDHLSREDGLFAFHADRTGRVLDQQAASDADLLIAWALLRYVAAAAAADAAGDTGSRDRLLGQAEQQHQRQPTYYGGAWVALGRLLLTGSTLTSC
jgi:endoglucanase